MDWVKIILELGLPTAGCFFLAWYLVKLIKMMHLDNQADKNRLNEILVETSSTNKSLMLTNQDLIETNKSLVEKVETHVIDISHKLDIYLIKDEKR